MQKITYFTLLLLLGASMLYSGCRRSVDDDPTSADGALYAALKNQTFTYYKGEDKILQPKGSSPHGPFKLLFNAKAASVLDSLGKLPVGATFPDSSIVLKEVFDGNDKKQLVPMMRMRNDANSAEGWLWGQYTPEGKLVYSVSKKGAKCVSCHQATGNRDLTLSFGLH
ncbi:MAG: cytochrome P460 family protein [Bacteroidia bacterium]